MHCSTHSVAHNPTKMGRRYLASSKAFKLLDPWTVQAAFKVLKLTPKTKAALVYRSGGEDMLNIFEVPLYLVFRELPAAAKKEVLEKARTYGTSKRKRK